MSYYEKYKVSVPEGERGPWKVERFTIEKNTPGAFYFALKGRSIPEGTYTQLLHRSRGCVMSDTPSEIRDHLEFIRRAKGRVLIHGLGLGMVLQAVLQKEDVTHVDVVEVDADVIALVGPHYQSDPRVHIHHGDAYTYEFPKGTSWDAAWHDIWDSICVDNIKEMSKLHRRYGRRAQWQGSWARELCEYHRRQNRSHSWY